MFPRTYNDLATKCFTPYLVGYSGINGKKINMVHFYIHANTSLTIGGFRSFAK